MSRYANGELVTLVAKLPDNAIGVVVNVWKVDGTPIVVDQPCQQIIISIFVYSFTPAEEGTYVWQIKGTHPVTRKLHTVEDSFFYGGVTGLTTEEHEKLMKSMTVNQFLGLK